MEIKNIHKWEKAIVMFFNLDGWDLTWTGQHNKIWDAEGYTRKGNKVVLEMKVRKKYYENKMLEKSKYDKLMELPDDIVKLYYVADPKGNYLFWLDSINMPAIETLTIKHTSLWNENRIKKEVYMLPESKASIVNMYDDDLIDCFDYKKFRH